GERVEAHDDVVRPARAARHPPVDDLRADAADAAEPVQLLAARGEQAVRGAEEAGGALARGRQRGAGRPADPCPLHDHRRRAARAGAVARRAGAGPGARGRVPRQGVPRRARQSAGPARDAHRCHRVGAAAGAQGRPDRHQLPDRQRPVPGAHPAAGPGRQVPRRLRPDDRAVGPVGLRRGGGVARRPGAAHTGLGGPARDRRPGPRGACTATVV
ncbi:MAG: hypothetical protein AVDCRST_MAG16-2943, partial [uncultured Frankineae bacterium]